MTRPSDTIKAVRSYTVFRHNGELVVKGSHWAPGYTNAHKETPTEAVEFAIAQAEKQMTDVQSRVVELHELMARIHEVPS